MLKSRYPLQSPLSGRRRVWDTIGFLVILFVQNYKNGVNKLANQPTNFFQGERFFPGWLFGAEEEWVAKIKSELEKEGFSPKVTTYNFCTNGSHYAGEAGIRTIGMGPARENLAHTIDEYAEVEDLINVSVCYAGIMKALLG